MTGSLARRLGTTDAVVIGLGSMIGAGVFSAFAPAAAAAGSGLLIGLRDRRCRRVLQCGRVGAARGAVPDLGRHVRLRPRAPRRVVGVPGRVGIRRRQDGVVRGDGDHVRGVRRSRARSGDGVPLLSPPSSALDGREPARHLADRTARAGARRGVAPRARDRGRARWRSAATPRRRTSAACSRTAASTACSRLRACSSSRSPATRASRRSARRCATRHRRSRARFRSRSGSPSSSISSSVFPRLPLPGLPRSRRATRPSLRPRGCGRRLVGAGGACRGGDREPRLAACVDRGSRTHDAGHGAQRRPAAPARGVEERRQVPARAGARRRRRRRAARGVDGPARRDRLLVVRRPSVLRGRERVGVHAGRCASALAARAQRRRAPRVHDARRVTLPVASIAAGTAVLAIVPGRGGPHRGPPHESCYGVTSPTNVPQSLMYGGKPNPPGMNSVAIQMDPSSPATAAE